MKTLQLSLKKKWFDMTEPDGKTEDYREINEYWTKRLSEPCFYADANFVDGENYFKFKQFDTNTMTLGYPKSTDMSRIKIFEHAGIEIREGKPEWGAIPCGRYFVVKHGKRIEPLVDHI